MKMSSMKLSLYWGLMAFAVLFSVTNGDWEVMNDEADEDSDNFLLDEHFLPADAIAKQVAGLSHRNLASVDQNGKRGKNTDTDAKPQPAASQPKRQPNTGSSIQSQITKKDNGQGVVHMTSENKPANEGGASHKSASQRKDSASDDDVNLADEGFLLAETKKGKLSPTGRKLAQVQEEYSENSERTIPQNPSPNVDLMSQIVHIDSQASQHLGEDEQEKDIFESEELLPEVPKKNKTSQSSRVSSSQERKRPQNREKIIQEPVRVKEMKVVEIFGEKAEGNVDLNLMEELARACLDPDSWDCKMFQGDYISMKKGSNLSHQHSVHHRVRRQTQGTTQKPVASLSYRVTSNFNNTVNAGSRAEIADSIKEQLTDLHKSVPGFRAILVSLDSVTITETTVNVEWEADFSTGRDITAFAGKNGTESLQSIVDGVASDVAPGYNGTNIGGRAPTDVFDIADVQQQLNASICVDDCDIGFNCTQTPSVEGGIFVMCTDRCQEIECELGEDCVKNDRTGEPRCVGLCEDGTNDCGSGAVPYTETETVVPPTITITGTSTFLPTTPITDDDLTEENRTNIAKEMKEQLENLFKDITGFKDVVIGKVEIKDGKIVIDWDLIIDPNFSNESPDQIKDTLKNDLDKVNDTYLDTLKLNGQPPADPFNVTDANRQVEEQIDNPCSKNLCSEGYDSCRQPDKSKLEVECTHKCISSEVAFKCRNAAICELDDKNKPMCKCTSGYSGEFCTDSTPTTRTLDSGEITGIAVGGALTTMGVLGCCCWFLLLYKRQRPIQYTDYTDEEGTGAFNSPLSKLQPCVIDRPHVSVTPIQVFRPPPPESFGSSSANYSIGGSSK